LEASLLNFWESIVVDLSHGQQRCFGSSTTMLLYNKQSIVVVKSYSPYSATDYINTASHMLSTFATMMLSVIKNHQTSSESWIAEERFN